jgi:hypothetical protein
MKRIGHVVMVATFVVGAASVASAQEKEPAAGTWKLNLEKSTFPAQTPESGIRTIEDLGGGFMYVTTDFVDSNGNKSGERFVARRDGRDYPYAGLGQPAFFTIALTLKSKTPYTGDGVIKVDGKSALTLSETLSPDGRTHTITSKARVGPPGAAFDVTTIQVWDKQ